MNLILSIYKKLALKLRIAFEIGDVFRGNYRNYRHLEKYLLFIGLFLLLSLKINAQNIKIDSVQYDVEISQNNGYLEMNFQFCLINFAVSKEGEIALWNETDYNLYLINGKSIRRIKIPSLDQNSYMNYDSYGNLIIVSYGDIVALNTKTDEVLCLPYGSNIDVFKALYPKVKFSDIFFPDYVSVDTAIIWYRSGDEWHPTQYKLYYEDSSESIYYYTSGLIRLLDNKFRNSFNDGYRYTIPENNIVAFRIIYINQAKGYCFYEIKGVLKYYKFGNDKSQSIFKNILHNLSYKYCEKENRIYAVDIKSQTTGGKLVLKYIDNVNSY